MAAAEVEDVTIVTCPVFVVTYHSSWPFLALRPPKIRVGTDRILSFLRLEIFVAMASLLTK
jgi:hypothetical protein